MQHSVEFESLQEARYLFIQSRALNGATHPLTLAAGTAVDYWFEKWCEEKEGKKPKIMEGKLDLAEQIADTLLHVVIDQQNSGENNDSFEGSPSGTGFHSSLFSASVRGDTG